MPVEAADSLKWSFNNHATVVNVESRVSVTLQTCQFSCATEHEVDCQKPKKSCIPFAASVLSADIFRENALMQYFLAGVIC